MIPNSNPLRIAIISGILHPKYGGPVTVIQSHLKGLSPYAKLSLFGVAQHDETVKVYDLFPGAYLFPRTFPNRWFRGNGLKKFLINASYDLDVLHAHMLWDYPVYAAWTASKKSHKPLFITPHGSLSAKWRHKALHKSIYRKLILNRMLNETACMHVLNRAEEIACRDFGIKCSIRIIPNGLPLTEYERIRNPEIALERWPQLRNRRILLYLGRLWSEKGLDILPEAWAKTCQVSKFAKDWLLVLAGPDYRNYQSQLVKRIVALGLENQILLTGQVTGNIKDSLLGVAEAFVLPSHSEGFSMSLLEAIAAGLPALYTTECYFAELADCNGGWEISLDQNDLFDKLLEIVEQELYTLKVMGEKARALGKERFTLEDISQKLISMYKSFSK